MQSVVASVFSPTGVTREFISNSRGIGLEAIFFLSLALAVVLDNFFPDVQHGAEFWE